MKIGLKHPPVSVTTTIGSVGSAMQLSLFNDFRSMYTSSSSLTGGGFFSSSFSLARYSWLLIIKLSLRKLLPSKMACSTALLWWITLFSTLCSFSLLSNDVIKFSSDLLIFCSLPYISLISLWNWAVLSSFSLTSSW